MSENINSIYHSIASAIVSNIDDGWVEATLKAELYGDATKFKGFYFSDERKVNKRFFKISHQLFDFFEELHLILTEGGVSKWNRATFTLEPTGKFNIDFEWDQEMADEIERLNKN